MKTSILSPVLTLVLMLSVPSLTQAQSGWKAHDMARPHPPVVTPGPRVLPVPPPSDAVVLFDGTDLSQWERFVGGPSTWTVANDYMEVAHRSHEPAPWRVGEGYFEVVPGAGDIRTKAVFGDIQLHIEWAAPVPAEGTGQDRGNSGIFLMGLYEVQVLDSYRNTTYADGQAAAVYGQYPPLVNASLPPGEWQAYDIVFHRPRFNASGGLEAPARVTVLHNGVLVQDDVALWGVTLWLQSLPYRPHADRLPLALQDHGHPVRFRNIWVRELHDRPAPPPADDPPPITLSVDVLDRYTGQYGNWTVSREGETLRMHFFGPLALELEALSQTHFVLKHTAGSVDFALDEQGTPTGLTFDLGGVATEAARSH